MGSAQEIRSTFPGYEKIYTLGELFGKRFYRGVIRNCEEPYFILRGEATLDAPMRVEHDSGQATPTDVVWNTDAHPLIVHERVIEVLTKNKFTGWNTYSVEVYDKAEILVPGYIGVSISGRCGPVDYAKSEIIYKDIHGKKKKYIKKRLFDEKTWDGSDLFMFSSGMGYVMILENVKLALEKDKVEGFDFHRNIDAEYNYIKRSELESIPPEIQKNFEDGLLITS